MSTDVDSAAIYREMLLRNVPRTAAVRATFKAMNVTVREVAGMCPGSPETLDDVVSGRGGGPVYDETRRWLAGFLGVSVDELPHRGQEAA